MDGDQREPDQDAEAVQGKKQAGRAWAGHHEPGPAADDRKRHDDEQRGHHPQRQVGRTSAHKGGCSGVVAQEAPASAAELENERPGQEHSGRDMDGHQRVQDQRAHQLYQD